MVILLRTLLLVTAVLPLTNAIPTTESSTYPATLHEKVAKHPSTTTSQPFRRLRDAIIEKIFAVPKKSKPKPNCHEPHASVPANFRTRYGADTVLRFRFGTEDEVKALSEAAEILYLDIWESTDDWVDIRISKDVVPSLLGLLPHSLRNSYAPVMHDLAQAVYDTYPSTSATVDSFSWRGSTSSMSTTARDGGPHDLFFNEYQPLSVLYPWLRLLASMFPDHVSLTSIGASAEGRDIPALRIGARPDQPPDHEHPTRNTLLITGGSHAREWISISSASYIAYSMVTRYGNPRFPYVTKLLDHFDLVFIPTLNPDGYDHTWSTDRLWRKNRQQTSLPFCPGVDIDRAFSFGWDGNSTADNPCSEDYAGNTPFQAVEAKRLADWARNETENNNVTFVAYLDLHSYSQQVLYPYSFSCRAEPPNLEDLEEVAIGLAKSFRITNGHYFGVSSACEGSITLKDKKTKARVQIESQGGSALDFFYHDLNVKYAYQIKLRDQGSYGFLLPKSNIIPSGYETFEAVLGLGKWLLGNHGIESIDDPSSVWGVEPDLKQEKENLQLFQKTQPVEGERIELPDREYEEFEFELRRRRRR